MSFLILEMFSISSVSTAVGSVTLLTQNTRTSAKFAVTFT